MECLKKRSGKFTKTKLASDLNWIRGLEIIKDRGSRQDTIIED